MPMLVTPIQESSHRGTIVSSASLSEYAAANDLQRVGARPPLSRYIAETWRYRAFTITFARYRVEADNERNRFGKVWAILRPTLNALLYGVVFGFVMTGKGRPDNFIAYIIIGTFVVSFLQSALSEGARSIRSNMAMINSLNFPRVCLPIAHIVQAFIEFLYTTVVLAGLLLVTGNFPRLEWLGVIPLLAFTLLFCAGLTMLSGWIATFFEDFGQIVPFLSRIVFYTSGVFFDAKAALAGHPLAVAIWQFNPFYAFLELWRGVLLHTGRVLTADWMICAGWGVILFAIAFVLFWSAEEKYGRP